MAQPPPWYPHRLQPNWTQQGNPVTNPPDMQHPPWNPGGLLPGPAVVSGPSSWSKRDVLTFVSDGTNQVATWETPVFDLRPGVTNADTQMQAAYPINHEAALGQSVYLVVVVTNPAGTIALASRVGTFEYWEDGHPLTADNAQLIRLTQDIVITDTVQAGGTRTATPPFGGSGLNFTPSLVSLRFWKIGIRFTIDGLVPVAEPYTVLAMCH